MPDDRFFHPRLRASAKVSSLTFLGQAVWRDMVLGADDFGVIAYRPAKLRADNDSFSVACTEAEIAAEMEQVIHSGLFLRFDHQGQTWAFDPRWQDFQKVAYPRRTYQPMPPPDLLAKCSANTRQLFRKHSNPNKGDGHRLTAKGLRLSANGSGGGAGEPSKRTIQFEIPESVVRALDRSPQLGAYPKLRDPRWWQAHVKANPGVDYSHQVLKAEAWLVTNPDKPRKKLAVFLHNWLSNAERPGA